jgi:hypothetical protein
MGDEFLKDTQLKKHVAAIHISGRLSFVQRKIANVLLLNAYKDLIEKDEFEVNISDLSLAIGLNSNNIEYLKKAFRALASTSIEWNLMDASGQEEWTVCSILSDATLKKGKCYYSYSSKLKKRLYNPSMYARINLAIQNRFSSNYALALYENAFRYKNIGSTGWIEVDLFRKLMGVEDLSYSKSFKRLKDKVIKPAIAEINEYSDIHLELDHVMKREKRKITSIRFLVKKKNNKIRLFDMQADLFNQKLLTRIRDEFGIPENQGKGLLVTYDEPYILEILDHVAKEVREGKIRNIPAFTKKALKEDFRKITTKHEKNETYRKIKEKTAQKVKNKKDYEDNLKNEYDRQRRYELKKLFSEIGEDDQKNLINQAIEKTPQSIIKEMIKKSGIDNRQAQTTLLSKFEHHFPLELRDFEKWKEDQ